MCVILWMHINNKDNVGCDVEGWIDNIIVDCPTVKLRQAWAGPNPTLILCSEYTSW